MSEEKRILRATDGRFLGGVCLGLARYVGVDVVIIRLAFVVLALNGLGVWVYFLLWLLLPDSEHSALSTESTISANFHDMGYQFRNMGATLGTQNGAMTIGLVLVAAGALLLISHFFPAVNVAMLWPILLIALGVMFIVRRR